MGGNGPASMVVSPYHHHNSATQRSRMASSSSSIHGFPATSVQSYPSPALVQNGGGSGRPSPSNSSGGAPASTPPLLAPNVTSGGHRQSQLTEDEIALGENLLRARLNI